MEARTAVPTMAGDGADAGNFAGEDTDSFMCAAAGLYRAGDGDGASLWLCGLTPREAQVLAC
jgi:hypothetical protein